MATITYTTKLAGVLANVTSVILTNAAGTIGIKRNDTGATVVAAGVAFTKASTGTYTYTFTAPAANVFYTAYVQTIASGSTVYTELVFFVSLTGTTTVMVPSAILAEYVIATLGAFTTPSSGGSWPLFRSNLPDGKNIADNIAAIFDTAGELQGKHMGGVLDQRYGIQFLLRCTNYDTGYQKLTDLLSSFENVENVDVSYNSQTFRIYNISQSSAIGTLGVEQESTKQRYLFSANLLVTIKET